MFSASVLRDGLPQEAICQDRQHTIMNRYYSDLKDAESLSVDHDGREYSDLAAVQWAALLALVDVSRDAGRLSDHLAIQVRDDTGPVMQVTFKSHPRQN
jgi:hypothetical protein